MPEGSASGRCALYAASRVDILADPAVATGRDIECSELLQSHRAEHGHGSKAWPLQG